ncbi:MAG: hypothetical protein Q9167_001943 [Letrouitia subvulpina]
MEEQVENAISIASDVTSDQIVKAQAFEFLHRLPSEPQGWEICLSLFLREPKLSEITRHTSLEVISNAMQRGVLQSPSLVALRDNLMAYMAGGKADSTNIQNKLAQTFMYLFVFSYSVEWPSFFHDLLRVSDHPSLSQEENSLRMIFYLQVLKQIHDEIADIFVLRTSEETRRGNELKDLVRERDMKMITHTLQSILTQWSGKDYKVIDQCLDVIQRWVSWTDVSLVVTDTLRNLLLELVNPSSSLSQTIEAAKMRESAIMCLIEILKKKMRPNDKLELIKYLKIQEAVSQLVRSPGLSDLRATSNYDTDLAEHVARLANNVVCDIVKALDAVQNQDPACLEAISQLQDFLPFVLRFFSDDYDEICSTVIPCLTDLLALVRKKARESNARISIESSTMLPPILDAIVGKMKYDETSSWGNEDAQTDEAEFQELRKRLHVLQQAVTSVDERLVMDKISNVVLTTFDSFQSQNGDVDWRTLDLALYEMYSFGEIGLKNGGLYTKNKPASPAAELLVGMMSRLLESDSDIVSSSHPAVHLQYMEICVRYHQFFEANTQFIYGTLENFIQLVHHNHAKVRTRSWYLFLRFVKHLQHHIGNIAEIAIRTLGDLLPIRAEIPDGSSEDGDVSSEGNQQPASTKFDSQLYLYEAIGCICSARTVPEESQILYITTVINPLFSDLEIHLGPAKAGGERAVLQVHHLIMALGTLARGFSDWSPANTSFTSQPPAREVSEGFVQTSEAILVALEALNSSPHIREATRFAFSRLVGVLGSRILPQLPRWIDGLLSQTSNKDEMALFMRLLDQVVYGFKLEIYDILNTLLTPFLQRVFSGMADPACGTDDEIQLAELKREFLNFMLIVLNNKLGAVLVSETNQSAFGGVISTIEQLAKDASDLPTAKLAFTVLGRMVAIWGGPDTVERTPQPALDGFDRFMIERFSPLCWALPNQPAFNPNDAQGKQALGEAAALQKMIYRKTGKEYIKWLRDNELRGMGMSETAMKTHLEFLSGANLKMFKEYFLDLVLESKGLPKT